MAVGGCGTAAAPPWTAPLGYGRAELHRLEIPRDGRPRVETRIDGRRLRLAQCCPGMPVVRGTVSGRPVLIQLDTGKTRTCVDPDLAAALGLTRARNGFVLPNVRIGSITFSVPDAKAVGFGGLETGTGEPIRLGVGSDVLDRFLLTVDTGRGTVHLSR